MYHNETSEEIIKNLSSDKITGLTNDEANRRLKRDGLNKLSSNNKASLISIILSQLKDPMIYILIATAFISAIIGEISDSFIILLVIIINTSIGSFQESKANKALDSLKKLSTPKALVKRDGVICEIPSENVVCGDIVIIDAGRYIPADLRLIETASLKIDESTFTGESLPSEKDADTILSSENIPLGDRTNMAYMSTLATYGRGIGIVVATAMDTEIGSIFKMIDKSYDNITPLQKNLKKLSKTLGFLAIGICILIFLIGVLEGRDKLSMLLTSLSLAVAAIPEGLPAIVAIVLALGVSRMIKENVIIKKLPAVETLGSVNIICSDKTGTLTLNQMTVIQYLTNNSIHQSIDMNSKEDKLLLESMILCNDATYSKDSTTGDPTEIALLDAGIKYNITKEYLNDIHERVNEIPFDSDRKLMTTVNKYDDKFIVFTKGALNSLLNLCCNIMINNKIVTLTNENKESILKYTNAMSNQALRVLGFAYKELDNSNILLNDLEKNLTFIGLTGMIDPPRPEVKDSINLCKSAGITPVMITGDHKNTAFAIASELGIASNINECLLGSEIDSMDEIKFANVISNYKVFARVSPEHKVKIVNAYKSHNNIVSMTGDGVNDAPSLKVADIGIAMGITGTDVAKDAADMILTDDNFATIINAVKEGRNVYKNIRKSIIFLLACNLGEIITLLFSILLNWPTPLAPIHILWINLITDSFPALALGVDTLDKDIMKEQPRSVNESLFSNNKLFLLINGILISIVTLIGFQFGYIKYPNSIIHARTIAFAILSASQLFFALTLRNRKKTILSIGLFTNQYLIYSILFGIVIQSLIISVPFLSSIFKTYFITPMDWIVVITLSLIPLLINEFTKIFLKKEN